MLGWSINYVGIDLQFHYFQALRHQLFTVYLPKIQLQEFYQLDIEAYVAKFGEEVTKNVVVGNWISHSNVYLILDKSSTY